MVPLNRWFQVQGNRSDRWFRPFLEIHAVRRKQSCETNDLLAVFPTSFPLVVISPRTVCSRPSSWLFPFFSYFCAFYILFIARFIINSPALFLYETTTKHLAHQAFQRLHQELTNWACHPVPSFHRQIIWIKPHLFHHLVHIAREDCPSVWLSYRRLNLLTSTVPWHNPTTTAPDSKNGFSWCHGWYDRTFASNFSSTLRFAGVIGSILSRSRGPIFLCRILNRQWNRWNRRLLPHFQRSSGSVLIVFLRSLLNQCPLGIGQTYGLGGRYHRYQWTWLAPSSRRAERAALPRVSPSILVKMTPVVR